jgi:hypothetical protein
MSASEHIKAAPQLQAMPIKQTALSPVSLRLTPLAAGACHNEPVRSRACSSPLEFNNDWSLTRAFWFSVEISHPFKRSGCCCMHDFL